MTGKSGVRTQNRFSALGESLGSCPAHSPHKDCTKYSSNLNSIVVYNLSSIAQFDGLDNDDDLSSSVDENANVNNETYYKTEDEIEPIHLTPTIKPNTSQQ